MAKMEFWGPFIGHHIAWAARRTFSGHRVCLAYHKWPPISVDQVNVDQLTFDPKKKPKFLPNIKDQARRNFSKPTVAVQPCQVGLVSTCEKRSFRTQFWGNKMWNHILYRIPLPTIKMSDKEKAAVNTVFCLPQILLDPKNLKNINPSPKGCVNIQIDVA